MPWAEHLPKGQSDLFLLSSLFNFEALESRKW